MSDPGARLHRAVRRLGQAFARLERVAASALELTVPQLRVLEQLNDGDGLTISALADHQGVAISTMTRNLIVLERRGLVAREGGTEDRRTVRIGLTEVGRARAADAAQATQRRLGSAFRDFHPSDRVERAHAVDRVAQALEHVDA